MDASQRVSAFELHAYKHLLPDALSISQTLLTWLVLHRRLQLDEPTVILGSNPVPEQDMATFLSKLGVTVVSASADARCLIVGRDDWEYDDLRTLLEMRIGSTLRVYSQEMLLAYAISGIDPLDQPTLAEHLAGPHPALHFLRRTFAFDWPHTDVPVNAIGWLDLDFFLNLKEGYLKHEGYTVGKGGLTRRERRDILDYCYLYGVVPPAFPDEYVDEWGTPKTSIRLYKIASCIASFCRNAKRRRSPPLVAIECWEEDLQHLKSRYYDAKYRFDWPNTAVW